MAVDLAQAIKLVALATNHASPLEERRTTALIVVEWLHANNILLIHQTLRPALRPIPEAARRTERRRVSRELLTLWALAGRPAFGKPTDKEIDEVLRRRLFERGLRPMTREEVAEAYDTDLEAAVRAAAEGSK